MEGEHDAARDSERGIDAVERAKALLDRTPRTVLAAPSRFGLPGRLARRALLRILRPYAVRQREVDWALLEAIRRSRVTRVAAEVAVPGLHTSEAVPRIDLAGLLPDDVVEVETDVGILWLDETDKLITPLISEHHLWEGDVVAFIRSRLERGMVFLDIGAHIGYFSVLASTIVGDAGHVVAVEPHPRSLELLRANLWRHGCENVTVLPIAAYEERGHVRFVSNPDGLAGSWIEPELGEATMVPCARLDELLGQLPVDLIKIDIERAEHLAIRGAERLIAAASTLDIVAEFWPTHPHAGGSSPAEVLGYYESLGLKLRLLQPDGSTEPATAEQVLAGGETAPIMNIVLQKG